MTIKSSIIALTFLLASTLAYAGAWGYRSFENDDALDWVQNSLKRDGQSGVEKAISSVAHGQGVLEEPQACFAIAACEVLLIEEGKASPGVPKDVVTIAEKLSGKGRDGLRDEAKKALERILGPESELNDLWKENVSDYPKWKNVILDMQKRL